MNKMIAFLCFGLLTQQASALPRRKKLKKESEPLAVIYDPQLNTKAKESGLGTEKIPNALIEKKSPITEAPVKKESLIAYLPNLKKLMADKKYSQVLAALRVVEGLNPKLPVSEQMRLWLIRSLCEAQLGNTGPSQRSLRFARKLLQSAVPKKNPSELNSQEWQLLTEFEMTQEDIGRLNSL